MDQLLQNKYLSLEYYSSALFLQILSEIDSIVKYNGLYKRPGSSKDYRKIFVQV